MYRIIPLVTDQFYHVYNKSIYTYTIFNTPPEYERMLQLIKYYRHADMPSSFSRFYKYRLSKYPNFSAALTASLSGSDAVALVRILAYCLMPTHMHFLLQQLQPDGIRLFMQNIQNGYSQFFNNRHNRRGPLWQSRFGNKLITDPRGLIQNSLYIHTNPVKDLGIHDPAQWPYSSCKEYLKPNAEHSFCEWQPFINVSAVDYAILMKNYTDRDTLRE